MSVPPPTRWKRTPPTSPSVRAIVGRLAAAAALLGVFVLLVTGPAAAQVAPEPEVPTPPAPGAPTPGQPGQSDEPDEPEGPNASLSVDLSQGEAPSQSVVIILALSVLSVA
ncbi:MAG: hypothetical protein ACLFWR_13510, partial [Acidimicrobiales bacterium]